MQSEEIGKKDSAAKHMAQIWQIMQILSTFQHLSAVIQPFHSDKYLFQTHNAKYFIFKYRSISIGFVFVWLLEFSVV